MKGREGILLAAFHAVLLTQTEALDAVRQLHEESFRINTAVVVWFEQE